MNLTHTKVSLTKEIHKLPASVATWERKKVEERVKKDFLFPSDFGANCSLDKNDCLLSHGNVT